MSKAVAAAAATRGERTWVTLIPAAVLLALAVAYPIARVLAISFADYGLPTQFAMKWRGLDTYARLLADSRYWTALLNTTIFTTVSVLLEGALGLAIALLLRRSFPGRRGVRALMMLPWAMPTAVMALAWTWIFNDSFGVANDLLERLGLIREPLPWLAEPRLAMAALIISDVWKTTPFVALIVLAGLQGIPESIYESAAVDGVSARRQFFTLTLPLVWPFLAVALIFRAVQAWAAFDLIYVMTGGGPGGSTETVSLYAQQSYFRYLDFGYASTIVVASILVLVAAVTILRWLTERGSR